MIKSSSLKNNLGGQILYRNLDPSKRRPCDFLAFSSKINPYYFWQFLVILLGICRILWLYRSELDLRAERILKKGFTKPVRIRRLLLLIEGLTNLIFCITRLVLEYQFIRLFLVNLTLRLSLVIIFTRNFGEKIEIFCSTNPFWPRPRSSFKKRNAW